MVFNNFMDTYFPLWKIKAVPSQSEKACRNKICHLYLPSKLCGRVNLLYYRAFYCLERNFQVGWSLNWLPVQISYVYGSSLYDLFILLKKKCVAS